MDGDGEDYQDSAFATMAALSPPPSLKHENAPQRVLMIAASGKVLGPCRSHGYGIDEAVCGKCCRREQIFGPVA